jgi:hypothetical protein
MAAESVGVSIPRQTTLNQIGTAAIASTAQKASVVCHECTLNCKGADKLEPRAAPSDNAMEYTAIIIGMFLEKCLLINPDSKGPIASMPKPASKAVRSKKKTE